jgi:hypothetical protein
VDATLHERNSQQVAFCVWALSRDGLLAPPFDQHVDGDGLLSASGFDRRQWLQWVAVVIRAEQIFAAVGIAGSESSSFMKRRSAFAVSNPSLLAPPRVRGVLDAYWSSYRERPDENRDRAPAGLFTRLPLSEQREFVRSIRGRHTRLNVYVARYPVVAATAVISKTMLVGVPEVSRRSAVEAAEMIIASLPEPE